MSGVVGKRGKTLTSEENALILECVKSNPENLKEAFNQAAVKLQEMGRSSTTFATVKLAYYNRLRKQFPIFTLEGRDQSFSNTKIISSRTKTIYAVENPTVAQLARQYNKLTSKQKQDFQVLIK